MTIETKSPTPDTRRLIPLSGWPGWILMLVANLMFLLFTLAFLLG